MIFPDNTSYDLARRVLSVLDAVAGQRAVVALADSCVVLWGANGRVGIIGGVGEWFKMDFPGRLALLDYATDLLRPLTAEMTESDGERVLDVVDRLQLPIELPQVRARRAELVQLIRDQLATAEPEDVIEAAVALASPIGFIVFERPLGHRAPERPALLQHAIGRLDELLSEFSGREGLRLCWLIERRNLPVVLAAKRREEITAQLHAAALAQDFSDQLREPDLEDQIVADFANPAPSSVLADVLQAPGDPRGELIELQLRAETDPSYVAAAAQYLELHAEALLGSLAPYQWTRENPPREAFTWRRGFVDHVLLAHDGDGGDNGDTTPLVDLFERVLRHPSARFVRSVNLGIHRDYDEETHDPLIAMLPRVSHLRSVVLGDYDHRTQDSPWLMIGDVEPLWSIETLRELRVHGREFTLGTISHPSLERLSVETGSLNVANGRAIAAAQLPCLRHLDVWFGMNFATLAVLEPLFARTDLPHLTHLGVGNADFADRVGPALAMTVIGRQLRSLDLSLGTLSDAGAAALVTALPHLERVDVSDSCLTDAGAAILQRAYPTVIDVKPKYRKGNAISLGEPF